MHAGRCPTRLSDWPALNIHLGEGKQIGGDAGKRADGNSHRRHLGDRHNHY